jgi:hypothetical protein
VRASVGRLPQSRITAIGTPLVGMLLLATLVAAASPSYSSSKDAPASRMDVPALVPLAPPALLCIDGRAMPSTASLTATASSQASSQASKES